MQLPVSPPPPPMLVLPEDQSSSDTKTTFRVKDEDSDAPPTYAASSVSSPSDLSDSTLATPSPEALVIRSKPVNFLSVSRNNSSIKDTFTIDPALQIPSNFLAPLSEGETEDDRKNLKLLTRNGPINVDIYVLTKDQDIASKKPTTIDITVYNGQLSARLHTQNETNTARPPFQLFTSAYNGSTTVSLPRSFHGPLTISSRNGTVTISPELTAHVTTLSEVDSTRSCFVGSFPPENDNSEDEAKIWAKNGRVKVQYEDEVEPVSQSKGFLGRLFGA